MTKPDAIAAAVAHAARVKSPKTREALRLLIELAKRPTGDYVSGQLNSSFE